MGSIKKKRGKTDSICLFFILRNIYTSFLGQTARRNTICDLICVRYQWKYILLFANRLLHKTQMSLNHFLFYFSSLSLPCYETMALLHSVNVFAISKRKRKSSASILLLFHKCITTYVSILQCSNLSYLVGKFFQISLPI